MCYQLIYQNLSSRKKKKKNLLGQKQLIVKHQDETKLFQNKSF